MRCPRWRSLVLVVAGVVTAVLVMGTICAWRPATVWVRWDENADAAARWARSSVVVSEQGGTQIIRVAAGEIRVGSPPSAGNGAVGTQSAAVVVRFQPALSVSEVTVCAGAPDGPRLPSGTVAGIGADGRSIHLAQDSWWRRRLRGFLPGVAEGPRTVTYVETSRRTVGGVAWRAFEAVPESAVRAQSATWVWVSPGRLPRSGAATNRR